MAVNLLLIIVAAIVTLRQFRKGIGEGLGAAVFFLVLLPTEVRLPTPGALPEITAHRILLLIAAWKVFGHRDDGSEHIAVPALGLMIAVAACRAISTVLGIAFAPAFKDFLGFVLESTLFFVVVSKGLRNPGVTQRVAWSVLWALIGVAVIATVEKYTRINVAARFIPGMLDNSKEVTATFRHRILLGYSLAMGFPLALGLWKMAQTRRQRIAANLGMILTPAACYFANSRGAWAGMAMAGALMAFVGDRPLRRRLSILGVLAALVLVLRPGVLDTIQSRWEHTKSTDTLKGRSASYRLELWRVAYKHLSRSAERFLFGYGGHATQTMDLGDEFEFGGNAGALGYTSWDSEYAVSLMQFGFVGFFMELALYLFLAKKCFESWRLAPPEIRPLVAGCGAAAAVYLWAMTNVAIFNPQLKYLFWTVVAIPLRSVYIEWRSRAAQSPAAADEAEGPTGATSAALS